ncbi:MAG: bifunctional tRNA (5-methylaminomethyl-2-thiouridine)(34)-methyltransferase MnmD/FAD-dependent 5-carboxymethylaminomethyl-2-thiouridine(34) oxidoreductase MnmC [Gammaproteobacteria bacterium]|nr:bifunctional tRNA (5-methylaminomethyl-2-thiouridine)(34)-methyltransferase MnmD/FAD-dependent 5-carboxymethylaminomethyl-2-thiouridine(34) oxidoreductase MnmC [Gammaproteobacteria bacterium]
MDTDSIIAFMTDAHKNRLKAVSPALIDWQDKTPVSRQYDDIYFSSDDGIAETEYVFLKQNNLPHAWQGKSQFCILETGFGTGLNFFCSIDLWLKTAADDAVLTYISVEKHPLSEDDFSRQQANWPQFKPFIQALVNQYPPMLSGLHSISLYSGRIKLLLLLGDACEQLSTLMAKADACYLDGFAPSKNKSMWSPALFKQLTRLLKPGATLSTFTAVGDVRRGLQDAGFEMKKIDAYGNKRHMLSGRLQSSTADNLLLPWYRYPDFDEKNKQVLVIGAGVAGLTTAAALSENGWQVTLIEQADSVAAGASGNPAGVLMPRLDKQQTLEARFYWQAFFLALRKISQLESQGLDCGWQASGVLQLDDEAELFSNHWPSSSLKPLTPDAVKKLAGLATSKAAVWLQQGGYISPKKLCTGIYERFKNQIDFVFDTTVTALESDNRGWKVLSSNGDFYTQSVVICNAETANRFQQTAAVNLQPVRGQISYLKNTELAGKLKTVICDRGYAIPLDQQQLLIGASFNRGETASSLTERDHGFNWQQFSRALAPTHQSELGTELPVKGRASVRAMTTDRLPVIGAVVDQAFYQQHYADLARGRRASSYPMATYHDGLFINAGHGSRGLTSCFLAADIILALMTNTALPVEAEILCRLHPGRFLIKGFQKNTG